MSVTLDSNDVKNVAQAAADFISAYARYRLYPMEGMRVANALARLGVLENTIDVMVSRETSKVEAILDGTTDEEPPF